VILCIVMAIVLSTGQWQSPSLVPRRTYVFLILSGMATGASWLCYFRALKIGDAARVAPIDKLSVVLVAVFGVVFLGERLAAPNWLGVALIAAGAVLVAYKRRARQTAWPGSACSKFVGYAELGPCSGCSETGSGRRTFPPTPVACPVRYR
jgi:transporter family protein